MSEYYKGNTERDSQDYRGWLVGSFVTEGLRRIGEVEIKHSRFDEPGLTDHPRKTSSIVEVTMVYSGAMVGEIGDDRVVVQAGEYIVIPPGVENNTCLYTAENTRAFTVKAPSDPFAKRLVA